MASLIYIADPMCSWCYGFGPQLSTLVTGLPEISIEIVTGGLRAYNRQVMDTQLKTSLRMNWQLVEKRTSLPFTYTRLDQGGFIYDTEPACRAVVTARSLAPQHTLKVFLAIQDAFYRDDRDITQGNVLAEIASASLTATDHPIDAAAFYEVWASEKAVEETRADFQQTKNWKINGFPTLVLQHNGKLDLVTQGYAPVDVLIATMQALIDSDTPIASADLQHSPQD